MKILAGDATHFGRGCQIHQRFRALLWSERKALGNGTWDVPECKAIRLLTTKARRDGEISRDPTILTSNHPDTLASYWQNLTFLPLPSFPLLTEGSMLRLISVTEESPIEQTS